MTDVLYACYLRRVAQRRPYRKRLATASGLPRGLTRLRYRLSSPITLGVRTILVHDGRVLLVRHSYAERSWYLPGGGVRPGETLKQAARPEAAEEAGAEIGRMELFGMYSNFYEGKSDHVAVLVGHDVGATLQGDAEVEQAAFFPPQDPPARTSPGTRRRLREYLEGQSVSVGP